MYLFIPRTFNWIDDETLSLKRANSSPRASSAMVLNLLTSSSSLIFLVSVHVPGSGNVVLFGVFICTDPSVVFKVLMDKI